MSVFNGDVILHRHQGWDYTGKNDDGHLTIPSGLHVTFRSQSISGEILFNGYAFLSTPAIQEADFGGCCNRIDLYGTFVFRPNMLYDIGFQLSFAVTFSIIMSSSIFLQYPKKSMQLFILSSICQLAALPILLFHFFEVSLLGVFLNVLYVPLYSIILLPFSLISLFIHLLLPSFGQPLISLLNFTFVLCNKAADAASELPLASIPFGKPPFLMMLLLVISLIGLCLTWEVSFEKVKSGAE